MSSTCTFSLSLYLFLIFQDTPSDMGRLLRGFPPRARWSTIRQIVRRRFPPNPSHKSFFHWVGFLITKRTPSHPFRQEQPSNYHKQTNKQTTPIWKSATLTTKTWRIRRMDLARTAGKNMNESGRTPCFPFSLFMSKPASVERVMKWAVLDIPRYLIPLLFTRMHTVTMVNMPPNYPKWNKLPSDWNPFGIIALR